MTLSTRLRELLEQDGVIQETQFAGEIVNAIAAKIRTGDVRNTTREVAEALAEHRLSDPLRAIMPEVIEALEGMGRKECKDPFLSRPPLTATNDKRIAEIS